MSGDTLIAIGIVLVATVYAVYKIFLSKSGGCGGCQSCSKSTQIKTDYTDNDNYTSCSCNGTKNDKNS